MPETYPIVTFTHAEYDPTKDVLVAIRTDPADVSHVVGSLQLQCHGVCATLSPSLARMITADDAPHLEADVHYDPGNLRIRLHIEAMVRRAYANGTLWRHVEHAD